LEPGNHWLKTSESAIPAVIASGYRRADTDWLYDFLPLQHIKADEKALMQIPGTEEILPDRTCLKSVCPAPVCRELDPDLRPCQKEGHISYVHPT
jgi:hypothetical protein